MNEHSMEQKVRGSVYISARAFNPYQMWRDYREDEVKRDVGYAGLLGLNALRVWLSYEFWLEAPDLMKQRYEHLLSAAAERGIRIMPSLFECCGVVQSRERLLDTNPLTAVNVSSPAQEIVQDRGRWQEPLAFVQWIMADYHSDERVLAIELINEPNNPLQFKFTRELLKTAAAVKGSVPLTVGSIRMEHNLYYLDLGIDIFQFHDNFPRTIEDFEETIRKAKAYADVVDKRIWLTEWQRLRTGRIGWKGEGIDHGEWQPGLATLADAVNKANIDSFFWSLMIKPAYLIGQRKSGTLNGMFHEDGAVWSLEDARAVSGHSSLTLVERKEWPAWCQVIPATGIPT